MYLLEKDYKDGYIKRKLFKNEEDLILYITKNIDTLFNAGGHSAEIRLNRIYIEGE